MNAPLRWYTAVQLDVAGKATPVGHMADPTLKGALANACTIAPLVNAAGFACAVAEYLEVELVQLHGLDGRPLPRR